MEGLLEGRLQVLQKINSVSNSTVDLDQTLESTARFVAEELQVDLCSIFFYDELQRVLTLRATNGPRPMGGMHYTLRIGKGYSEWLANKGRPLLFHHCLDAGPRSCASDYHHASRAIERRGPLVHF